MTAYWHHGRLCAIDIESTDVDVETARIVSGTVALVGGGRPMELVEVLADPGVEIPQEAIDVHGITNERARAEGLPAREAVQELLRGLQTGVDAMGGGYLPLVAYNAKFDLTILDREARRHGLLDQLKGLRVKVVCPMVIDRHLDRFRPAKVASHGLEDVCRLYGARLDGGAHNATADCVAAARVAWAIVERGRVVRRVRSKRDEQEAQQLADEWQSVRFDLDALYGAQRRWALAQANDFADYLVEHGDEERADEIREREGRFWPVIPPAEVRRLTPTPA